MCHLIHHTRLSTNVIQQSGASPLPFKLTPSHSIVLAEYVLCKYFPQTTARPSSLSRMTYVHRICKV